MSDRLLISNEINKTTHQFWGNSGIISAQARAKEVDFENYLNRYTEQIVKISTMGTFYKN